MSDPAPNRAWTNLLAAMHRAWPVTRWQDSGVVVGCSGGADSACLLRAICQTLRQGNESEKARGFVVAAHFNHGLRGSESDADQSFVAELAETAGIQLATARGGGTASDEATMRAQRERFLQETAERLGARYVAVAHSADDNVETVLHHLLRGTGPGGLSGIPSHRELGTDIVLVRPLLNVRRAAIREALRSIGQDWREDSSNQNVDYRRNWIRHQLIPLVESEYPQAVAAIDRAIAGQRGWRDTMDRLARNWLDEHCHTGPPVRVTRDDATDESIVIAACQSLWSKLGWPRGDMGRSQWQRLAEAIAASNPQRFTLPGGIDVTAEANIITLNPDS